jgi:hypothetical protein
MNKTPRGVSAHRRVLLGLLLASLTSGAFAQDAVKLNLSDVHF